MKRRSGSAWKVAVGAIGGVVFGIGWLAFVGVAASDHPTLPARIGEVRSTSQMEAMLDIPGPITTETFAGGDWAVDRGGLINLDHPEAKKAGLSNELEPITIFVHLLRHPQKGLFIIDTGVEKALRDDPENAALRGPVAKAMHLEKLKVKHDTASVIAAEGKIAGVFLTHLHVDHISGLPDVPRGTPIYAGPGETTQRFGLNVFSKPVTDRELEGHLPIAEWQFRPDTDGRFEGILDVFGDESLFAIWVPGHTAGSTAYVARTARGPVLFTGDTCHTAWGWIHGVEPGAFTRDRPQNAVSLSKLKALATRHPAMMVRLGHQPLRGMP
jgi:N-acyl homoserine lactone hydrolase